MSKIGGRWKGARVRVRLCVLLFPACFVAAIPLDARTPGAPLRALHTLSTQQNERIDIRLRSFVPNASGQLTVEPSAEGGRARLTALRMPDPRSQSRDARTYVVWANSEGRIVRLGELTRDSRGNGGLAFAHPGFERYTVIVTAETSADAERPLGAPVLSTRAGEATAVYAAAASKDTSTAKTDAPDKFARRVYKRGASSDFYTEVDDALTAQGGGRLIELEGAEIAPRAEGRARATAHTGRAYVVVRFSEVPLPHTVNAGAYAMWAIQSNGRIVYMGSMPNDATLNRTDIYVRVPGFNSDEYDLFVTAEPQRPAITPSDRRALSTRNARNIIR